MWLCFLGVLLCDLLDRMALSRQAIPCIACKSVHNIGKRKSLATRAGNDSVDASDQKARNDGCHDQSGKQICWIGHNCPHSFPFQSLLQVSKSEARVWYVLRELAIIEFSDGPGAIAKKYFREIRVEG